MCPLKQALKAILLVTALAALAPAARGETFYVDARKGLDTNAGTRNAPWKTIQKAADALRPGDTVQVEAGNYPERIQVINSGARRRPITYAANGRAVTEGFRVTADHIRVIGFEITSRIRLSRESYGVYVRGRHVEIVNNYIHDVYHDGIMVSGEGDPDSPLTAFNIVRGNRIYRASGSGIHVEGRHHLIEANDISHIIQYPPGGPVYEGADADGLRPFGTGHIFRNNRVHDILSSDLGNLDPHIDCIETWGPAADLLFEQNVCDAEDSEFVPVQGAQIENGSGPVRHITFRNNIFMNVRVGVHFEKISGEDITEIEVVNNTFYNITHQGVLVEGTASGTLQNNAFYDVGSHRESYLTLHPGASQMVIGYNSQAMSDGRPPGKRGSQAPYARDVWGIDPKFANAAAKDFRLLPDSPLINAGVTFQSVTTDFAGVARPQGSGYDIGAYEYVRSER